MLLVESGEETTPHDALTVNVSDYGIRVEAHAPLTPGQVLYLVLPGDPTGPLRCLVVWSADVTSDGKSEAGLEFLRHATTRSES
ncbi:MAG: PilZ domain-containing protein [Acidobacteria bacterium]|nr:PilZ domain-containing protein [Acidobacteriota bacterium]